jgi:Uma2 family endonuclease
MHMQTGRRLRPTREKHRYLATPVPLHFPVEEEVPEGRRHMKIRTLLFQILELGLKGQGSVGSDQFVYWNARNPSVRLAPDVFVGLGIPDDEFSSWKTWERKTPELAVEIVSPSDTPEGPWQEKLDRYHELGVQELVRFDRDAPVGQRLRIWDRVDENLLEREVEGDRSPSEVIDAWWVVVDDKALGPVLRPAHDAAGHELWPTPAEFEARARERAQLAREAAERRFAEVEEELGRRGS